MLKLTAMTNDEIIARLRDLVQQDCKVTAQLLRCLAEVDRRQLHLPAGFSSLHVYCIERLGMSENQAYLRINVARLGRKYPMVFDLVATGALHLAGAKLLGSKLTADNHEELLQAAAHKSKRQIEQLIAARFPRPPVPPSIQRMVSSAQGALPLSTGDAPAEPAREAAGLGEAVVGGDLQGHLHRQRVLP